MGSMTTHELSLWTPSVCAPLSHLSNSNIIKTATGHHQPPSWSPSECEVLCICTSHVPMNLPCLVVILKVSDSSNTHCFLQLTLCLSFGRQCFSSWSCVLEFSRILDCLNSISEVVYRIWVLLSPLMCVHRDLKRLKMNTTSYTIFPEALKKYLNCL